MPACLARLTESSACREQTNPSKADPNRALLDRRVVRDMLGFDDSVYEGVRMLAVAINRPVVRASITRRDKMRKLAFRRQIQLGYGHLRLMKIPGNDEWSGGYLRLFCPARYAMEYSLDGDSKSATMLPSRA